MGKGQRITYWVATLVLASGLIGSGVQQLVRAEGEGALAPPYAWGIVKLGYPLYVLTLLGIWKLLGAVALLVPKYPLVKEWAYAGVVFLLTGGIFSHVAAGDSWNQSLPALFLLILAVVSWYSRPADRRLLARPARVRAAGPNPASAHPATG